MRKKNELHLLSNNLVPYWRIILYNNRNDNRWLGFCPETEESNANNDLILAYGSNYNNLLFIYGLSLSKKQKGGKKMSKKVTPQELEQRIKQEREWWLRCFEKKITEIYNECWIEVKERIEKLERGEK